MEILKKYKDFKVISLENKKELAINHSLLFTGIGLFYNYYTF